MNIHYHFQSFKEAFSGLKYVFSRHPNFRIHLVVSIFVLLLAYLFQISKNELIILIFAITLGFAVEFLNTAVESVCDLVTLEWRKDIKIAKDVAAAMMLITAMGLSIVGILVFLPYLF